MRNHFNRKPVARGGARSTTAPAAALLALFVLASNASAHGAQSWQTRNADRLADTRILASPLSDYRALSLDLVDLRALLDEVAFENSGAAATVIDVPMPDGSSMSFRTFRSTAMAPELAAKFPQIRSFVGYAVDHPEIQARFDDSPLGFNVMIRGSAQGVIILRPTEMGEGANYISYRREALGASNHPFRCELDQLNADQMWPGDVSAEQSSTQPSTVTGANIRTYRLAMAADGEYTAFFGGTVVNGMASIVQAVNRVNGIYLTDFAVQFQLVGNNDLIVYTDPATDPYTDNNGSTMLTQNQSNINTVIGTANYDFGHVFSTGGGGVAGLGTACGTGKARGVTGSTAPTGDDYWVDYVAHEMGHQMGANHSFNGTSLNCGAGNRSAVQAYEPGSGSTIMAYAGICGVSDLQPHSDAIFHAGSIVPIVSRLAGTGGTCGAVLTTTNHAPVPTVVAAFSIPMMTPFQLTGSATDQENDPLTYIWEEFDLGAASPPETDDGSRPIFRSFVPTTSPVRIFPKLSNILSNTSTIGESLPTTTRAMKFRFTVRDNRPGGGATNSADTTVNVTSTAGPFVITAPDTAVTWFGNQSHVVTWNVAGTNAAPVSCSNVDIGFSLDGGLTFPFLLAPNVPNTGTANVITPNLTTNQARIKVSCVGNIFFDISNANFTTIGDRIFANDFE
jgi:Metallo-peptidase family M12